MLLGVVIFLVVIGQTELIPDFHFVRFDLSEKPFVAQIERMRMFPVVMRNVAQPLHHLRIVNFDGQLPPAVKASRGQVDRPHNRPAVVRQQHLAVQALGA